MKAIAAAALASSLALLGCRSVSPPPFPAEAAGVASPVAAAGEVRGTVRTPEGTPVQDACVAAVAADRAYWLDVLSRKPVPDKDEDGLVTTRTDSNGRFRIDGLQAEGRYFLVASAEGWATSGAVEPGILDGRHPAPPTDLVLRKLAHLELLIVDSKGTPVPLAHVGEVIYDGRFFGERTLPQGDRPGQFVLDRHFPGGLMVRALAPGFGPAWINTELDEGEARAITVRLDAGVSIRGVVVDDRGLPIEGARVSAVPEGRPALRSKGERPITTGSDGRFEIPDLSPGKHSLRASARSARSKDPTSVRVDAPAEDVVLRLVRLGGIRFRLRVPEGGRTPRGVDFALSQGPTGTFNWLGGEFREEYLVPGTGRIRLYPEGYAPLILEFSVGPGETLDLGEHLLDEGVSIGGRVLDSEGRPVVGAIVTLVQRYSTADPSATTGLDGNFAIPHAAEGANRIQVSREGFVLHDSTVQGRDSESGLTLVLHRGGLVRVRVMDPSGKPAPSVAIEIVDADGPLGNVPLPITDMRGACEVRLPAGSYSLGAHGETRAQIDVSDGDIKDILLNLR